MTRSPAACNKSSAAKPWTAKPRWQNCGKSCTNANAADHEFVSLFLGRQHRVEEIVLYIFDLNPVAAHHFLDVLEETCELLAGHPFLGRQRPELGEAIRSFPIGNYLIFYVPAPRGIDIARVIYGGRDLPEAFRRQ